ncbi:MAG: sensor histidine kinase, partial [Alphaproteobacteria bacterium]
GDLWCVTWRLYLPDGTPLPDDQCLHAIALRENRPVRGVEAVAERPDGTRVPFIPYPTPLRDADGKLIGAINMLVDITERKKAENRQKVLIDELNHRVKNTLATVQSLATQTARHTNDIEQFVGDFETRLLSLSRVHDLLTKQHWGHAPVETIVREVIAPLADDAADRIRIGGPSVKLDPRMAVSISMALNELSTNAAKYGALCTTEGSLTIGWSVRDERVWPILEMVWQERDGPPVVPPKRRGFGSRLMERCIERDLDGEFDLVFDPDGVQCRISIPLAGHATA